MKFIKKGAISFILIPLLAAVFTCTAQKACADSGTVFSVTVPTGLPVFEDGEGNISVSPALKVINRGNGPVTVTDISISGENGWELTDYSRDISSEKVDSKKFALSIAGRDVPVNGIADTSGIGVIEASSEYTVEYGAKVPLQSRASDETVIGSCLFTVGWQEGALWSVEVIRLPDKTVYCSGENFDPAGMIIEAVYYGGARERIDGYVIEDGVNLTPDRASVTVSYEKDGREKSASVPITVKRTAERLELVMPPTKTSYESGERFNPEGMIVEILYTDGGREQVEGLSFIPDVLAYGTNAVSAVKEIDGVSWNVSVPVTVTRRLSSLEIVSPPSKTVYAPGESFDQSGSAVRAHFADGSSADVTGLVSWSKGCVGLNDTSVTASYAEGGTSVSASVPISVRDMTVTGIVISCPPSKVSYFIGESFDPSGAAVTARYSDGSERDVTPYVTWSKGTLMPSDTSVGASFEENGSVLTADVGVSVTKVLKSIYVAAPPAKTVYAAGESFDASGMRVRAVYEGGYEEDVTDYRLENTAFTFTPPASTVQTFTTVKSTTPVAEIAEMFGITMQQFWAWNNNEGVQNIRPKGSVVYVSDPALDEAVTCDRNFTDVYISYTDGGVTAGATVGVTVMRN